jgi:two-component system, NarL family, sensor histidine kinase DegS
VAVENARLYEELARAHAAIHEQAGQLQRLLRHTMHVQEQERRRIAADIHDSAIQLIYGALYEVEGALKALPPDQPPRPGLQQARGLLNRATGEIRTTIFDLWPTSLDETGLLPALRSALLRFEQDSGVQCRLQLEGAPPPFAPWAAISLFRIVQEALQNVRKHAAARTLLLRFRCAPDGVTLAVEDDGAGFDPAAAARAGGEHLGLISMRERAFGLGGTFAVEAAPGRGTRLTLRFPRAGLVAEGR